MKHKAQISWNDNIKKAVWTEIVTEKIRNQSILLKETNAINESRMLVQYLSELEFGDVTNREGHAAKVYFNALFGKEFSRGQDNSINAALNYGYSLLLSAFNREITANGYMTQLGLFHDNMFNPYNLSSDLMEPFRVFVDKEVILMDVKFFAKDEKIRLLSIPHSRVLIGNTEQTLLNSIKIYTKSVFDAVNDNDVSLIAFPVL